MTEHYIWCAISVIALVTALTRFLPFVIFRDEQKVPQFIRKLGNVLPHAIMGMLVVYCLKDVQITEPSSLLPAVLSCLVVAVLHILRRNTLLSILVGTVCYMCLVQIVF